MHGGNGRHMCGWQSVKWKQLEKFQNYKWKSEGGNPSNFSLEIEITKTQVERRRFLYFKFLDKIECPSTFKRPFSILTIFPLCYFFRFFLFSFFLPSFADSFSILLLIQWWCGWRGEHRHGADDRLKRGREQFESGVRRSWTSFRYRIRIISNWMLKDSECSTRLVFLRSDMNISYVVNRIDVHFYGIEKKGKAAKKVLFHRSHDLAAACRNTFRCLLFPFHLSLPIHQFFVGGVGGNICFKTFLWFFSTAFFAFLLSTHTRPLLSPSHCCCCCSKCEWYACTLSGAGVKSENRYTRTEFSWVGSSCCCCCRSEHHHIVSYSQFTHCVCHRLDSDVLRMNEYDRNDVGSKGRIFFCVWNIKTFELGCGDDDIDETGSHWRLVD